MGKIKVASQWLESCAGCHMSFLDIDERIVELLKYVELSSTPITDLKHPPESGVDVGILTGGIGNEEQEEEAKLMRSRCKVLIAMGDCAVTGGICTMRNFFDTARSAAPWLHRDREHRRWRNPGARGPDPADGSGRRVWGT